MNHWKPQLIKKFVKKKQRKNEKYTKTERISLKFTKQMELHESLKLKRVFYINLNEKSSINLSACY